MEMGMRFTVTEAAFEQMKRDGMIDEQDTFPYKYDEIYVAETPEEQAYMTALPGSMYHPGEICDCPPQGHPNYEAWRDHESQA